MRALFRRAATRAGRLTPTALPALAPLMRGRAAAIFTALVVAWSALSWQVVSQQVRTREAASVAAATAEARQSVSVVRANLERVLNRHQGIAAVMADSGDIKAVLAAFGHGAKPSSLDPAARKAAWTRRPDLLALNRQLQKAQDNIGVDFIWVMNAGGDCVAASNFAEPESFVGTNYAFREYFQAASEGRPGRHFAVGRVKKVPGMFYSAPVVVDGRVIGAVAIRTDLPRIASAVNHPHAFVSDEHGVIVLAPDSRLEMRALPGASVYKLAAETRQARYMRTEFETLRIDSGGGKQGLVRVGSSPYGHVSESSEMPQHGITAHVLMPVTALASLRSDAFVAFVLMSLTGILLLALVFGARSYVLRVRQHRQTMEASNARLLELNEHLDRLAKMDPLTRLANRRHFQSSVEAEIARARRHGRECSVIAIDVDFFKRINDAHGHAGGDEALRHVAQVIRQQLRGHDAVGRLGGEEFAVLLPETGLAGARNVAERIRAAIEATTARFGDSAIGMTASLGVAAWRAPAESFGALLQRADRALYAAKGAGRNRVESDNGPVARRAAALTPNSA